MDIVRILRVGIYYPRLHPLCLLPPHSSRGLAYAPRFGVPFEYRSTRRILPSLPLRTNSGRARRRDWTKPLFTCIERSQSLRLGVGDKPNGDLAHKDQFPVILLPSYPSDQELSNVLVVCPHLQYWMRCRLLWPLTVPLHVWKYGNHIRKMQRVL